jgi:hypothetical protein
MSRILPLVAMLLATALAGPLLALTQSRPRPGEIVIVASLPWSEAPAVLIERAGGKRVGPDATPIAVLAIFEDRDFIASLKDAGAWLVLDGQSLSAFCGV